MNKEFIPYEQALELKEFGFDEECFGFYTEEYKKLIKSFCKYPIDLPTKPFLAPTFSQAFRWFRTKYGLQYNITWNKFYEKTPQQWEVRKNWTDELVIPYGYGGMCSTYEEAELACLNKLIEIVKQQKIL